MPDTNRLYSVISYLFVVWIFLTAWLNPLQHLDFIYGTGVLIYLVEFFSIHSSGMLQPNGLKLHTKLLLGLFYVTFVGFAMTALTDNIYPLLIFIGSVSAKVFAPANRKPADDFTFYILLLLGTTFFTIIVFAPISGLLPLPEAVSLAKPATAGGMFTDQPQTLLFWGILYYGILAYRAYKPMKLH